MGCIIALLLALAAVVVWPRLDLTVSSWFYTPGSGFWGEHQQACQFLHWIAYDGARALGVFLALAALVAFALKRSLLAIDAKGWLFLFLALMIAPVLVGNVVLKDHWGRDRPREITEFGGTGLFTPAIEPHFANAHANGSFVSGDGAFGFFLPAFAYVAPRRHSRRFFWDGMGLGMLFGGARVVMGAHFLSDVLFAALFMLATVAALHAAMYGRRETAQFWRLWTSRP